ncbi:hypothetical protein K2173_011428 [Erythroxylum novogranatense]|uniref:Protein kinase domain-containing protein n=1 Tax=Erythroxylum novogranatense TaxID=1862640 RepID=A0AAV8TGP9_9ROSI|nr:hypothetical protein K2173_011428 [Erythroxylum novogranatense]
MTEYQHQPHLDSIDTNLIALVDSTSALRRGFTTIVSSLAENKLLLQEILNLLPPLTNQDQSHEEPEGLLDSTEIHTIGAIVEAEVFDEMLHPTSEETWMFGDNDDTDYSQARFDMKDVFLHIKLIEQASVDESPAMVTQEASNDEVHGSVFKLTFACNYSISWPAMSGSLDSASLCYQKIQIFEKKGFTLGVVHLLVQAGQANLFKVRIENALKSAIKRPKPTTVKLPFSLCGFQDEHTRWSELGDFEDDPSEQSYKNGIDNSNMKIQVAMPLPTSSFVVSVDERQTIQSGGEEIAKWLLNSDHLEFIDPVGPSIFKGVYKGRRVGIEKLKRCDKGNAYAFDIHRDLLESMTCGHKNILQFYGVCVDENHGLCVVTKLMEGGSVSELIMRNRKLQMKEIVRIATDFAEAIKFVNDHDVAYQDLNTQRILLARHGIACLGEMGIVTACKILGEAVEYAPDGYRWLAPEIIAHGVIKKSLLMSNTGSINGATDGDLRLVHGDAIVSQCDHTLAAINVKPFDPGGHFATIEISSRVVMDVG